MKSSCNKSDECVKGTSDWGLFCKPRPVPDAKPKLASEKGSEGKKPGKTGPTAGAQKPAEENSESTRKKQPKAGPTPKPASDKGLEGKKPGKTGSTPGGEKPAKASPQSTGKKEPTTGSTFGGKKTSGKKPAAGGSAPAPGGSAPAAKKQGKSGPTTTKGPGNTNPKGSTAPTRSKPPAGNARKDY